MVNNDVNAGLIISNAIGTPNNTDDTIGMLNIILDTDDDAWYNAMFINEEFRFEKSITYMILAIGMQLTKLLMNGLVTSL